MSTSTATPTIAFPQAFALIPGDIYRNVHKAVRANMFEVVLRAGRTDPADRNQRIALAASVCDLADFLTFHAEHEDRVLDPMIAEVLPDEAASITASHDEFEAEMVHIRALAALVFEDDRTDAQASLHELYLALAAFTSRYLAHQHVEERVVMPALLAHFGLDGVIDADQRIVASISPDGMAWSLAKMLPAMNNVERVELLAIIRAGAPSEAFAGMLGLAAEVLDADDFARLNAGLDAISTDVPA
jgi:hypothetical protein